MLYGKALFIFSICFSLVGLSQGSQYSVAFEQADNDHVTSPSISSTFGTGTNDFTVECFISLSSTNNSGGAVTSFSSLQGGWAIHISGQGKVSFIIGTSSNQNNYDIISYAPTLSIGKWYHIAGVKKGTTMEMFVNGVSIGSKNINHPFSTISDVIIGKRYTDLDYRFFDGQIDEVRIWDRALNIKEVRDWMCKKYTNSHPNSPSLVRYYNFKTGFGTTVIDHVSANNGTFVNSPTWRTSGAPIGDESTNYYSSNPNISLNHPSGESLTVNSFSSSVEGVHIYRVDEAPNTLNGVMTIPNTNKYFGVFKAGDHNNTSSYDIIYNYNGNPGVGTNEPELGLYERLDNSITSWNDAVSVLDIPSKTVSFTSTNNAEIILGKVILPLPIELISFDVSNTSNSEVQIDWTTASETNNDYFTIERSLDGEEWREVQKIKGAGFSTQTLSYESIDKYRVPGTSYYRLKQTDFDGEYSYSQTKSITLDDSNNSDLNIYPNPFENQFFIHGSKSLIDQVRIFSSTGRDVTGFATLTTINDSFVRFDLSQLSSGLYFVITETTSNKIVKY